MSIESTMITIVITLLVYILYVNCIRELLIAFINKVKLFPRKFLRVIFIIVAPKTPPLWYQIESTIQRPTPPDSSCFQNEDIDIINKWIPDPCYDLPERMRNFQLEYLKYKNDLETYQNEKTMEIIVTWPLYYADCILKKMFKD